MKPISRTSAGCLSMLFLMSAAVLFGAVATTAALLFDAAARHWLQR